MVILVTYPSSRQHNLNYLRYENKGLAGNVLYEHNG